MTNISEYQGIRIADRLEGLAKECYLCAWEWMKGAWGNNVEFERLAEQILLCPETRDYLYKNPPQKVKYIKSFVISQIMVFQ